MSKSNTDNETIHAKTLVNASGAWANVIARTGRREELPLRPCRRHLFVSPPIDWVDPSWPFVWDVTHDIYFRPEGEGLLLCACDQTELPPGDPPVEESVKELLAEKIERFMPALSAVSISKGWAGFRTLTPDGRFIIGWDPKVDRLFLGRRSRRSWHDDQLRGRRIGGGPAPRWADKKSSAFAPERFIAG